ncbi:MAG: hypothetical protein ACJ8C4_03875 [Gemmataceae bacterium]
MRFAFSMIACAAVLLFFPGCILPEKFTFNSEFTCPAVCQVGAAWNNKVIYAPDPTRNGTPAPGLAGRLYLFGAVADFPFIGDGSLVIDMYDDTVRPGETLPNGGKQIEEWRFDPLTLKKLAKKDAIGEGYTVFLPWGTYRPDIRNVHLVTRYEPVHGMPIYAAPNSLSVDHGTPPPGATPTQ